MTKTKTKTNSSNTSVNRRSHNRTTLITTDRATFRKVQNLRTGKEMDVAFPNDIISSGRNEDGNNHHSIRRVALLRRQLHGGYRNVRVRCEMGTEIPCIIQGSISGTTDACVGSVRIKRV